MTEITPPTGEEYGDLTVLVSGAVSEQHVILSPGGGGYLMGEIIARVQQQAQKDGLPTQIFLQWHAHPVEEEDCSCAQYEQDGHPLVEWNMP